MCIRDRSYTGDVDELKKTRSLGSYSTHENAKGGESVKGESVKASLTTSSSPGSSSALKPAKIESKRQSLPETAFVGVVDSGKDSLPSDPKSNRPVKDSVSVSKQDLKNSIQQRMINLLNSSEESFNARKKSRAKATEDELSLIHI